MMRRQNELSEGEKRRERKGERKAERGRENVM
jgi:hypothetical protein